MPPQLFLGSPEVRSWLEAVLHVPSDLSATDLTLPGSNHGTSLGTVRPNYSYLRGGALGSSVRYVFFGLSALRALRALPSVEKVFAAPFPMPVLAGPARGSTLGRSAVSALPLAGLPGLMHRPAFA